MALVNVQSNGNAPAGTKIGDVVNTAGGQFAVVSPNTQGASYNPSSGLWSVKVGNSASSASAPDQSLVSVLKQAQNIADSNNAQYVENAKAQYAFNSAEAEKNRKWQEEMSNSAHQRETQDLIKAGLNPVLSALGGNGAYVGSGASASGSSANVDTSVSSSVAGLFSALLNASTNLAITEMNNKTAVQTAGINAKAQMYASDTQYSINKDFPNNPYRWISSLISPDDISSGVKHLGNISNSYKNRVLDKASDKLSTFWNNFKNGELSFK